MVLSALRSLDGGPLLDAIGSIRGVINPQVVTNFRGHRKILSRRLENDPKLFKKEEWLEDQHGELRRWVMHQFGVLVQRYPWNNIGEPAPVIPVVHGTDADVAWKILSTGFSALSSVDAGFYGRGIYFTSSAQYALPYYSAKPKPALLLCLAIPGNIYPVVEGPRDKDSLLGAPIKSGYQSNYVLTNRDGNPCRQRQSPGTFYDELVLDQEAQVVPVAIIEFSREKIARIAKSFQRDVPKGV